MDRALQRARTFEVARVLVVEAAISQALIGLNFYPLCTSLERMRTAVDWFINDPLTKKRKKIWKVKGRI